MEYTKPNFEFEWEEAQRYPEFSELGKEGWIERANNNFEIDHYKRIKDVLGNVDLDFDNLDDGKKDRFYKSYEKGKIEIPIAVKFSEDDYDLVAGNTRLAGLIKQGKNPKIWVVDMTNLNEEKLKGGLADNKTIEDVAKKHSIDVDLLKVQLENGIEVEHEHVKDNKMAKEIALDHLMEDPEYYIKLKKMEGEKEVKETGASSAGGYVGPMFSVIKKKDLQESIISTGQYDVPAFGKTPKGGRKNPLKIDGPDSIYKGRAVKDKNFPKWGGPDSVFVKIKEKCKKFPYCNQGDTGALEFIKEDEEFKIAISKASKMYGIPYEDVEKIVINEITKIFI